MLWCFTCTGCFQEIIGCLNQALMGLQMDPRVYSMSYLHISILYVPAVKHYSTTQLNVFFPVAIFIGEWILILAFAICQVNLS